MRVNTNNIILSKYALTNLECKLIFYFSGQIAAAGCGVVHHRYAVKKLLQITGLTKNKIFYLHEIMSDLFKKTIQINKPNGWIKYHWFDTLEWDSTDEVFILHINKGLKPYLLQLRKKYTLVSFQRMNAKASLSD
jgi:hypothetical protein